MINREKTIGFKVRQLFNAIKRDGELQNQRFENRNISMMQRWIIGYLAHNSQNDVFQKDLERELKIGKSTLTEILHVMEKNDLVVRMACKADARCKKLVLTKEAESIHEEIEKGIELFEIKLRNQISDDELSVFFKVVNQMLENVQKE